MKSTVFYLFVSWTGATSCLLLSPAVVAQSDDYMNMMNSMQEQMRMLKRQQDEQDSRRQAERERIERDNAAYREMQAQHERAAAERARINAAPENAGKNCSPTVMQMSGLCYHDGVTLDGRVPPNNRPQGPSPVHTSPRPGQR
jgi:FKBP-type peptidyl-prolyl cis-trans isomerase